MNNFVHLSTEFAKETFNDLKDLIALAGANSDLEFCARTTYGVMRGWLNDAIRALQY